jgi:hypothetical protein
MSAGNVKAVRSTLRLKIDGSKLCLETIKKRAARLDFVWITISLEIEASINLCGLRRISGHWVGHAFSPELPRVHRRPALSCHASLSSDCPRPPHFPPRIPASSRAASRLRTGHSEPVAFEPGGGFRGPWAKNCEAIADPKTGTSPRLFGGIAGRPFSALRPAAATRHERPPAGERKPKVGPRRPTGERHPRAGPSSEPPPLPMRRATRAGPSRGPHLSPKARGRLRCRSSVHSKRPGMAGNTQVSVHRIWSEGTRRVGF